MTLEVNHDWFAKEVKAWYDRAVQLNELRKGFNHSSLPPLSPQVGALADMIPVLNDAHGYMATDLQLGARALKAIADRVAEAGRKYGLTEEESAALAARCILDD